MNIKKGINRIGIVAGLIVALLGFYFGADIYDKRISSTVDLVFTDDFRSYIKGLHDVEIKQTIKTIKSRGPIYPFRYQDIIGDDALRSILMEYPELKEQNPLSDYKSHSKAKDENVKAWGVIRYTTGFETILVGLAAAAIGFFITIYGVRGLYLLITWLLEGFKEENST